MGIHKKLMLNITDWTNMWVSTIFKDKYVIIDFRGINT